MNPPPPPPQKKIIMHIYFYIGQTLKRGKVIQPRNFGVQNTNISAFKQVVLHGAKGKMKLLQVIDH